MHFERDWSQNDICSNEDKKSIGNWLMVLVRIEKTGGTGRLLYVTDWLEMQEREKQVSDVDNKVSTLLIEHVEGENRERKRIYNLGTFNRIHG